MNEFQNVMLKCLKEFIRVCNENELNWWADGGTLLGAVREKGFIEWDTDADVIMPREDYEKLMQHPEWFGEEFFLSNDKTENEWYRKYAKLHFTNSTAYSTEKEPNHWNKGICLDIFPLDELGTLVADLSFGVRMNCVWEKEWWEHYTERPFEDILVRVPLEFNKVLTKQYGDWKTPNKEGGSHSNADTYLSLEKEW